MEYEKIKTKLANGEEVEALNIPITQSVEKFSELTLDDGTTLLIKTTAIRVGRVIGKYDQKGEPIYNVQSANLVAVKHCPEELRK